MRRISAALQCNTGRSGASDVHFTVHDNFTAKAAAMVADRSNRAAHIVAQTAMADTDQYVPMLTGSLKNRTRVVGSSIIYPGPYARYLYYGKVMVNAATGKGPMHFTDKYGNEVIRFPKGATLKPTDRDLQYTTDFHKNAGPHWFERSKAQNLEKWLRVAERAVNTGHE